MKSRVCPPPLTLLFPTHPPTVPAGLSPVSCYTLNLLPQFFHLIPIYAVREHCHLFSYTAFISRIFSDPSLSVLLIYTSA